MRGIVLLLLGGSLAWWIWSGVTAPAAKEHEGPGGAAPLGRMLTRPEPQAASSPPAAAPGAEPAVDPEPAEPRAAEPRAAEPRAAEPRAAEPRAAEPRAAEPRAAEPRAAESVAAPQAPAGPSDEIHAGFEDPVALAECLLHRPHELPQVLESQGVSDARRRLVLALAHAAVGHVDQARSLADGLEGSSDVLSSEWDLLQRMIAADPGSPRAASAAISRSTPLLRAATLAWTAHSADEQLKAGRYAEAARALSDALLEEIQAPWPADPSTLRSWSALLERAQARHRWRRDGDWPSVEATVEPGDNLVSIRKRVLASHPDLQLCTGLIARVNELQGDVIHPGDRLRVPTDHTHVLVDLDARFAFYIQGDEVVAAWEVGIGKPGHETKPGTYTVGDKQKNPMWFPEGRPPVPFGDPENPLGTRWIAWLKPDGTKSGLGFHGTNEPGSTGQAVSDGCVRMQDQDVEALFEILPQGATIVVQ
jgi:L,D-transpeptidase catalytic domain/LysM domain